METLQNRTTYFKSKQQNFLQINKKQKTALLWRFFVVLCFIVLLFYCFVILLFFLLWRFFCFFVIYCFVVIVLYLLLCFLLFCNLMFRILLFCIISVEKSHYSKQQATKFHQNPTCFCMRCLKKRCMLLLVINLLLKDIAYQGFATLFLRFVTVGFQRFLHVALSCVAVPPFGVD